MFYSLWPHGLQHTRPPCPSPTPRDYSNSCPLSWWCHPNISSSVVPFSSSSATANIKCNPTPSQINTNHHLLKTELYSFTVQEARCSKSGFGSIDSFLETWRKKPSHASLLCRHVLWIFASISMWFYSLCIHVCLFSHLPGCSYCLPVGILINIANNVKVDSKYLYLYKNHGL